MEHLSFSVENRTIRTDYQPMPFFADLFLSLRVYYGRRRLAVLFLPSAKRQFPPVWKHARKKRHSSPICIHDLKLPLSSEHSVDTFAKPDNPSPLKRKNRFAFAGSGLAG